LRAATWLAPEVMNNEEYSIQSDVYSFGVILWEIFTQKIPFAEVQFFKQLEDKIQNGLRP
jgi:serine/threonine protein kinase